MKCLNTLEVDFSKCNNKCEGLDIISYNQLELESKLTETLSNFLEAFRRPRFDKNPTLTKYISKLSHEYNKYKDTYDFPSKNKGRYM